MVAGARLAHFEKPILALSTIERRRLRQRQ